MKKLINRPLDVVPEMLAGLVARAPGLRLVAGQNVVVRSDIADARQHEVALIAGGGSGHEPAHGGYVGPGMLHAAVSGDVFASPSVDAVLAAIRVACGPPGALLIVKNYTGDRLNFGLAAEIARASGLNVEMVLVADDVALDVPSENRRGIAGTVLVHKIAGAVAASRAPLAVVADAAGRTAASLGTMGVALGPCIVPAAGTPSFTLGADEIELGLGIHGEAGARRVGVLPARELVAQLLATIIAKTALAAGSRIALLVNDLGGTPPMELEIVTHMALAFLRDHGYRVERVWCGRFLTAIEMPGVSLTLLPVDDDRLGLLDAPSDTVAWPRMARTGPIDLDRAQVPGHATTSADGAQLHADGSAHADALRAGIDAVIETLVANEAQLTELDQVVGDGDLGISLARAATGIRELGDRLDPADPAATLAAISARVREVVGGTSGPLYAVFLLRAARSLADASKIDERAWSQAFLAGCDGMAQLGGAQQGDRTMLDALQPAAEAFAGAVTAGKGAVEAWRDAVSAAQHGTTATATMVARRGRSQYLGERVLSHVDPGAAAAALWLAALTPIVATYLGRNEGAPKAL